ncbi:MAG TPA: hypothetical protein VMX55_09025 [candidate division Zixibacteria bacterium]|nr:hypothetical protein [candidate division Zixibacteria bacterium]
MVEESSDLKQSLAFKEYSTKTRHTIKTPWGIIILVGVITAIIHTATAIFAITVLDNPWSLNFIIGLYGLPAGFAIAFKNHTLSFLVSFRYSSYSALVYTGIYTIITLVIFAINPNLQTSLILSIAGIFLTSLVIGIYQVLMFAIGTLIGTFTHGVLDAKGH